MEASSLIYGFWVCSSGVILAAAAMASTSLKSRDRYTQEVLSLLDTAREGENSVEERATTLCEECRERTNAGGTSLYLNTGSGGIKKLLQAGASAEVTGPGVVRDLLMQSINSGQSSEAVQGGRFLMALPVASRDGAALLLFWEDEQRPGVLERSLLDVTVRLLSFLLPALQMEGEMATMADQVRDLEARASHQVEHLEAEVAEEHHLASVGRLAAGVAHELNTPLGAVLTMVGSLLRKEDDANKKKRLTIVKDAVEKCKDIINKLLVYSRSPIQTEKGLTFSRFVRADTDLNAIISGIGEMMGEELKKDDIKLEMDLAELPAFRANGSQWSHVFTNLIANARDALREANVENACIKVQSRLEDGHVVVGVGDNGPGVPEPHRAKIFEPFFTTKEVGRGTGLGLAICREIVRKHKGDLVIKQSDQGGALFEITLDPNAEQEPMEPVLPREQYP